ncbi:MAG: hypothetical protein JWM34_2605 [Ilumatobacteraceae bacterium]|nr:hypothetical protein [Ilumatobacteraceae bacterium]
MLTPRIPRDEAARLDALERLQILDTAAEERFDRLTELASTVLGTPIALVSLIDRDRQWFKSRVGVDATETSRDISFCGHAIAEDGPGVFVIEDASLDARFADNPLVTGDPEIRFYAGKVVHDAAGFPVGTLCAIDRRPRRLDDAQMRALEQIALLVEHELERSTELQLLVDLDASEHKKALILDTLSEGVVLQSSDGKVIEWNPAAERVLGLTGDQLCERTQADRRWIAYLPDGTPWAAADRPAAEVLRTGVAVHNALMGVLHPDGSRRWLRVNAEPIAAPDGGGRQVLTVFADVTVEVDEAERQRVLEDALARSEHMSRVSLDALEQGVMFADRTGTIHRMNPAAQRILGYSLDELTALWKSGGWQTYDEAGRTLALADWPLMRALRDEQRVEGQIVGWRRRDGQRILVRVSCEPNGDGEGSLVLAFTDITADHLARRLLDATLDTAPVGLAILDTDRSILRCNATFADQAGRSVEDLIGVDVVTLVRVDHQPDASLVGRNLREGVRSGAELEQCVVRPDGTEIWVKTHLAIIPDPDRPLAIAATFDVTVERELLRELTRFGYLFQHANDIILVIDVAGNVLYASPSSERILGYPAGWEHPGGILNIVHPDDAQAAAAELGALIAGTREPEPFTARIRTFTGGWKHIECVGVNLLDEPAVGGIVITARDATERVRLTEQLAHQAQHDALTDLPNRQLLEDRLTRALARAHRGGTRIGLCFIDLDGFKAVNDTLGHAVGDQLLVDVAQCLRTTIRAGDTAARIGGDEFVIVLDAIVSTDDALEVVTRVRNSLLEINDTARHISFGASIGIALSEPDDTTSSLLLRADVALYRAKETHDSAISLVA